jgi:cytochrome c oxidase subunit IV
VSSGEHQDHHGHHVVSVKAYVAVFAALMVLTFITVWAAGQDFGAYNTAVAVGIAVTKATLVVLIFMHVKWGTKLTQLYVVAGVVFLLILIAITMSDYISRAWPIME